LFRIKNTYLVFSVFLVLLFHISYYNLHKIPYAFCNITLLLLTPLGYFYSNSVNYILIAVSWTIFLPVFLFVYRADIVNASFPLVTFNAILAGLVIYKKEAQKYAADWKAVIEKKEAAKKHFAEDFKKIDKTEREVKEKELAIASLYEITKMMSESLKFNEIFNTFSSFLKENFIFRRCELLILIRGAQDPRLDRIYSVWSQTPKDAALNSVNHEKLIKMFSENPSNIYLSIANDADKFEALSIDTANVQTFAAIPLLSGKKVVGILTVENMPQEEFEKFMILAMEFTLEIKKVLLYETVEKLAITDSLTSLYVRRYFLERMEEELQRSRRYAFNFSFLMIDIDDFKRANDTYGHLVGDVILKEVSAIMKEVVREIDLVARYGGEEFAVLLPETGMEGAKIVAERIKTKVAENTFKAYDERLHITVSIGVAVYPDHGMEAGDLIEGADAALYAAKKLGKNVVCECKK